MEHLEEKIDSKEHKGNGSAPRLQVISSVLDCLFKCSFCKKSLFVDFVTLRGYHFPTDDTSCKNSDVFQGNNGVVRLALSSERKEDQKRGVYTTLRTNVLLEITSPYVDIRSGFIRSVEGLCLLYFYTVTFVQWSELITRPREIINFVEEPNVVGFIDEFAKRVSILVNKKVLPTDVMLGVPRSLLPDDQLKGKLLNFAMAVKSYSQRTDLFYGDTHYYMEPSDIARVREVIYLLRQRILRFNISLFDGSVSRSCHSSPISIWCCFAHTDSLCTTKIRVLDVCALHPSLLAWSCCECCWQVESKEYHQNLINSCVVEAEDEGGPKSFSSSIAKTLVECYLART